MKTRSLFACIYLVALLPSLAHAQATKIFVASTGNDANDGSRGSPKRNFQAAHNAVAAGGEIVVLDTAGYSALVINKSVSVIVPPGVNGFITVTGSANAISINAASTDVVALRGLIVEGGGPSGNGSTGIAANSVGTLTVEDCTVRNFQEGISAGPSNNAQFNLYNTAVRGCNIGLIMANNGAVSVAVSAIGCRVENCGTGAYAVFNSAASGGVDCTMESCVVRGNGIGLETNVSGAVMRASNCTITGNGQGASTGNGSQLLGRGNNTLENNTNNNTFPGTYSGK